MVVKARAAKRHGAGATGCQGADSPGKQCRDLPVRKSFRRQGERFFCRRPPRRFGDDAAEEGPGAESGRALVADCFRGERRAQSARDPQGIGGGDGVREKRAPGRGSGRVQRASERYGDRRTNLGRTIRSDMEEPDWVARGTRIDDRRIAPGPVHGGRQDTGPAARAHLGAYYSDADSARKVIAWLLVSPHRITRSVRVLRRA